MSRAYLKKVNIETKNTPFGWKGNIFHHKERKRRFKHFWQRRKYGFDDREIWDLDYTFYIWLYERLRMYEDVSQVDLIRTPTRIIFQKRELNLQEAINEMTMRLEFILTERFEIEESAELIAQKKELLQLFSASLNHIWW